MTHGRERKSVRQDDRAGVVANGNGGVDSLRGNVRQRDAGSGAVGIVERHDVPAGIPVLKRDLRFLVGTPNRLAENGETADGAIGEQLRPPDQCRLVVRPLHSTC